MAGDRRPRPAAARQHRLGDARPLSDRRRGGPGARHGRAAGDLPAGGGAGAPARPARPALPCAPGCALGLLPAAARRRGRRGLGLRRRLFQAPRRHPARPAVPLLPRLPRQHGAGHGGGRRLFLHGGLGDDGAVVVLPHHLRPRPGRDPPRRLPVPADRAPRRDLHPAELRRAAGRHGRLHLRAHARAAALGRLGNSRLPARAARFRRQGGHRAAARLAARSASGGALAGFRAALRGHAEDRGLRPAARHARPDRLAAVVVGRARARARAGLGACSPIRRSRTSA